MKLKILIFFLALISIELSAQKKVQRIDNPRGVVCYAQEDIKGTKFLYKENGKSARTEAATIEVTYNGFSTEAKVAFQAAIDIWENSITSPISIRVEANWEQLAGGVLGSASPSSIFRNFEGALQPNTWYPVSLAEKLAHSDLNLQSEPDIVITFNSDINWYYGSDGNPDENQYDLVSVVLHEIGHGLGFLDSFDFDETANEGGYGFAGLPIIYDQFVVNASDEELVDLTNGSAGLGQELTSENLFFNSESEISQSGLKPKLHAPSTWNGGSSISHLDETNYPSGNPNSLMTPSIGRNEVMQDLGQIVGNIFRDMGWENTYIEHQPITNNENIGATEFPLTVQITSDNTYDKGSVTLVYSLSGFDSDTTEIIMTETATPNEFQADIPATMESGTTYTYFIRVNDNAGRTFTKPSLVPLRFYEFTTTEDLEGPIIEHDSIEFIILNQNEVVFEAKIKDFIGVENAQIEYFVNEEPLQSQSLDLIDEIDSVYKTTLDLTPFNLQVNDSIKYRIVATDNSSAVNSTVFPVSGLIKMIVISTKPVQESYSNDFNDIILAEDDFFSSPNFRIAEVDGFQNGAIHSDHPYEDGSGLNSESNYIYQLRVPILLNNTASLQFDEVALIEPGEPNTEFGDVEFWDYVIIEGSKDGGETWEAFISGYDSRANTTWTSTYNSGLNSSNNSTATGNSDLFRTRMIDMLENTSFTVGDEVLIRFRLFADPSAHGWGWAIDNLKIQIDTEPPKIKHDHIDYLLSNTAILITTEVTDNTEVDSVYIQSEIDNQVVNIYESATNSTGIYEYTPNINALSLGDTLKYRIVALDTTRNMSYLPSQDDFFNVPYIEFGTPVNQYSNDFEGLNTDFVGNFFTINNQFISGAVNSYHPYPEPFGLEDESNYAFTLKTPITIDSNNPFITFDEIFIGTLPSDNVFVEASKDQGNSWVILSEYNSESRSAWTEASSQNSDGSQAMIANRLINMIDEGLTADDEVILRFRLKAASSTSRWGWWIDNLEIQTDQITSFSPKIDNNILIYPNPVEQGEVKIDLSQSNYKSGVISLLDVNGNELVNVNLESHQKIDFKNLPSGIYMLKIKTQNGIINRKIVKY